MKNVLFYMFILAGYILVLSLPLKNHFFANGYSFFEKEQFVELVKNLVIIFLSATALRKIRRQYVLNIARRKRVFLTFFPIYLVGVGLLTIDISVFCNITLSSLLLLFLSTMSIGLSEELVFRGLLQNSLIMGDQVLTKMKLFLTVLFTSLIFAALHLLDATMSTIFPELAQFFYSLFIGVGFGAIALCTGRIYSLGIIHGMINFSFSIDSLNEFEKTEQVVVQRDLLSDILNASASVMVAVPMLIIAYKVFRLFESKEYFQFHELNSDD